MVRKTVNVKCPYCGSNNHIAIYESINVVEENGEKIKEAILGDVLHGYFCIHCCHWVRITYPTIYHDPGKKIIVCLAPDYDKSIIKRTIQSDIHWNGYRARVVADPDSLKEKILISEKGLDDRVIEYMKYKAFKDISHHFYDDFRGYAVDSVFFENDKSGGMLFRYILQNCSSAIGKKPLRIAFNLKEYNHASEKFISKYGTLIVGSTSSLFQIVDYNWAESLFSGNI